jgi:hypothetical protein
MSSGTPQLVGGAKALPGLGPNKTASASSSAGAVTESYPYVAGGGATLNGTNVSVRWQLP